MVAALCYCIKTDKVCSGKPPENLPLCDLHLKLIPTVETETETKRFGNCYGAGTCEAVIDAIGSMAPQRFSCAVKAYAADLLMQAGFLQIFDPLSSAGSQNHSFPQRNTSTSTFLGLY